MQKIGGWGGGGFYYDIYGRKWSKTSHSYIKAHYLSILIMFSIYPWIRRGQYTAGYKRKARIIEEIRE